MKSWFSAAPLLTSENINDALPFTDRACFSLGQDTDAEVRTFFDSLGKLIGVPITHLVPDESMLPMESLRFFYLDPNWRTCLLDGACSVGRNATKDCAYDRMALGNIVNTVTADAAQMGFLLRSDIVRGWPGLQVRCLYRGNDIGILRLERMESTVLLCIASGQFDEVTLAQPDESVHFGLQNKNGTITQQLRSLKSVSFGKDLPKMSCEAVFRGDKSMGVLNVREMADRMEKLLIGAGEHSQFFSSLEFAVQMIEKRESVTIKISVEDAK